VEKEEKNEKVKQESKERQNAIKRKAKRKASEEGQKGINSNIFS